MSDAPDPPVYDDVFAAAAELQQLLLASAGIDDFLHEIAILTVAVLPGEMSCGITMRRDHRPMTVASSDARASRLDEVQYGHDQGPCLTSMCTGQVVIISDLAEDDRWGAYQSPALAGGTRSSLSLPLSAQGRGLGALNIYSAQPHTFGQREQRIARRFAEEAARALALAVRMAQSTEMSENLQIALASRAVIDQALGVIMGQNRCGAEEAFRVLRAASQNRNIKLRVIAGEIITATCGNPPSDTPPRQARHSDQR